MTSKATVVFIRSEYNYNMDDASFASGLACGESMAKQEFKEECDINTIVERFGLTGQMPEQINSPLTGDFTEVTDYRGALHLIMEANAAFMEIPANVRERFGNDAGRFVAFVSDEANKAACAELGLTQVVRPKEPLLVRMEPMPAPEVSPGVDNPRSAPVEAPKAS